MSLTNKETTSPKYNTVMSGMRPTGKLHIGHYFGVLKNWVQLQEQYDCFFMIADWHALTTKYNNTTDFENDIYEMTLDWLAAGINPEKATLYVQSGIPEIAELHLLLSMLTPLPWVQGDPTLKDMVKILSEELNYGLLGYPVLQTADILAMLGQYVPVGKDQLAHLEISRDIARRFNHIYQTDLLPEPRPLLTEIPMLIGLDGQKMSKSLHNSILLSDDEDETWQKLRTGITDPARVKKDDPGSPDQCQVIYKYYEFFASPEAKVLAGDECRSASRGCVQCKKILLESINETLRPIREQRKLYATDRYQIEKILKKGQVKAREVSQATLQNVRRAMKLYES